jgi:hypothetical protein
MHGFTRWRPAKAQARFRADFAVTKEEHQWEYAFMSTPSLELVFVLLDLPHDFY